MLRLLGAGWIFGNSHSTRAFWLVPKLKHRIITSFLVVASVHSFVDGIRMATSHTYRHISRNMLNFRVLLF